MQDRIAAGYEVDAEQVAREILRKLRLVKWARQELAERTWSNPRAFSSRPVELRRTTPSPASTPPTTAGSRPASRTAASAASARASGTVASSS